MKKLHALALVVIFFLPSLACSAELPFYLGIHSLRTTAIQQDRTKIASLSTTLVAGKYFADAFALEARYGTTAHELGQHPTTGHQEIPRTFLATFLRADWEFERVIFFGLAGYNWQGVTTTDAGVHKVKTKGDFAFGMGLEYRLTPHIALEAEYVQYLSRSEIEFTGFDGGLLIRF